MLCDSIYKVPRIVKFINTESKMVLTRAWGRGNGELLFYGYEVSVFQEEFWIWRW